MSTGVTIILSFCVGIAVVMILNAVSTLVKYRQLEKLGPPERPWRARVREPKLTTLAGSVLILTTIITTTPVYAQELAIPEIVAGIILNMTSGAVVMLRIPANDTLDPGDNNTWVGFQSQTACPDDSGVFRSTVGGGAGLPCVPDSTYPPFGAGLQVLHGLSPDDCRFIANVAAVAVQNKVLPGTSTSITSLQNNNPITGVSFGSAGGVCSATGGTNFVGWLLGSYVIAQGLSDAQCAFWVNMCSSGCSCGLFYREF